MLEEKRGINGGGWGARSWRREGKAGIGRMHLRRCVIAKRDKAREREREAVQKAGEEQQRAVERRDSIQ